MKRWDRKVFTLCALFSSYVIYNSTGVPTSDDVEKLSFISQFSSSIQGHLSTPIENTETAVDIFPNFMWLIRDAVLQPEVDGQKSTWKKFLLSSVLCVEDGAAKHHTIKAFETAIRRSFQNFDAQGIPPPSVEPDVVQNLLSAKYKDQINKKFLHRVEEVIKHVLACAQVSKTGQQLAMYVSSCVNAVNLECDKLPIQTAWESFLEANWNDTLNTTMEKYDDHANQINFPISAEDIVMFHNKESSEVQKAFTELEASNFDESSITQYREKLNLALERKLHTIKTKNITKSHSYCETVATSQELHFDTKVESLDNYTFEDLMKDSQKVIEEYLRKAKGPSIDEVKEALEGRMDAKMKSLQPALIQNTIETVEKVYEREVRDTIQSRLPLETNDVDAEHQRIRNLCVNQFQKRCRGYDEYLNVLSRVETALSKRLQSLHETNLSLSNVACERAIKSAKRMHFDPVCNLVSQLNISDLTGAKNTVLAEYERDTRGPAKDNVKREYEEDMDEQLGRLKPHLAQHALTEAESSYKRELDNLLQEGPLDSEEASVKCFLKCTTIRASFETRCNGLENVLRDTYNAEVEMVEINAVNNFHRRNDELSSEYCQNLMTTLIQEILQPSINNVDMFVSYDNMKNSILQQYDERAKGPKADEVKQNAVQQIDIDIEQAKRQRVVKGIGIALQAGLIGIYAII